MNESSDPALAVAAVWCYEHGALTPHPDTLAVEAPLTMHIGSAKVTTLRTPGADAELAAGFALGEGLLAGGRHIVAIEQRSPDALAITLSQPMPPSWGRHTVVSAACGACGGQGYHLEEGLQPVASRLSVAPELLLELPQRLRQAQQVFGATGGLHGCALFDATGSLIACREDVGRHNALDKLMGWALLQGLLPLSAHILMLSGRAGSELLSKAIRAGIAVVASVSAPSSLAVDLAQRFGVTLVGFVRGERFVCYSHPWRLGCLEAVKAMSS
jgi:FdhD protein